MKIFLPTMCAILLIICLTSCNGLQTISSSSTFTETPTSELTTTCASTALPLQGVISSQMVEALCTGIKANSFMREVGLPSDHITAGIYLFQINDGSGDICEVEIGWYRGRIDSTLITKSASLIKNDGNRILIFDSVLDSIPVNDFQFDIAGSIIKIGQMKSETELLALIGKPLKTQISENEAEGFGEIRIKTLFYSELQIVLMQQTNSKDKNLWRIQTIICSDPNFSTPRGLKIGLDLDSVIKMIGTGEFLISFDALQDPINLTLEKWDNESDSLFWFEIDLTFNKNILSDIEIHTVDP